MNYILATFIAILLVAVSFVLLKDSELVDEYTSSVVDEDTQDVEEEKDTSLMYTGKQTLDLSGQGLTKVPDSIFSRTDLEVLNLSRNDLDGALQAEVRHLQGLIVLDLSDNNFTGVPAEVGQLTRLEILDLSNNPITGLPHEIGDLKNLKVLDLRGTNYAEQDLMIIRQGLSSDVEIKID